MHSQCPSYLQHSLHFQLSLSSDLDQLLLLQQVDQIGIKYDFLIRITDRAQEYRQLLPTLKNLQKAIIVIHDYVDDYFFSQPNFTVVWHLFQKEARTVRQILEAKYEVRILHLKLS